MTQTIDEVKTGEDISTQPPYNVILLDDSFHTYYYVINMLRILFGYDELRAFKLAEEVDDTGRVIVYTGAKETAELKRDQIHSWGADRRLLKSKGSMSATIEPAPG